jgi:hypothetical protein
MHQTTNLDAPRITNRFALEKHAGRYESWPLKTRLLVDSTLTDVHVPGYSLLHQFSCDDGFLLITDYDCPFEEATGFTLLNADLQLAATRTLAVPYGSFLLDKIEWLDQRNLIAVFHADDRWKVSIAPRRFFSLRSQLSIRHLSGI